LELIKTYLDNIQKDEYKLIFEIDNNLDIIIYGSYNELSEIKFDFESFSPMEQRAHINAVLNERISK
jgi:hypothetical protein